jgi:dTDP-4-amino-4,6-dideoxygalactose transaminase
MTVSRIPFLDLITPNVQLEQELISVTRRCLQTAGFIGGQMVTDFESDFAGFCHTKYCVGVNSGTDAIRFALMAAGVGPGDSVITVPNTFIATTEAISQAGAVPEFVDVDERTGNLDPRKLREYLERNCVCDLTTGNMRSLRSHNRVAAVIPVHLYGQMAEMDPILEIARKHRLVVIEDACQAHGAQYFSTHLNRWCRAGSMGRAGTFSFYPGKNLGACGEAGAITTNDENLAERARMLRDHGQAKKYHHELEGYNGRLDAMQAGFLSVKLAKLSQWNSERRNVAYQYRRLFHESGCDLVLPPENPRFESVYHLFVVRVPERDRVRELLLDSGIDTGIHYPVPLHLQNAYRHLGYSRGDFPVSEQAAGEILSLPMFPTLTLDQQRAIVSAMQHAITFSSTSSDQLLA